MIQKEQEEAIPNSIIADKILIIDVIVVIVINVIHAINVIPLLDIIVIGTEMIHMKDHKHKAFSEEVKNMKNDIDEYKQILNFTDDLDFKT